MSSWDRTEVGFLVDSSCCSKSNPKNCLKNRSKSNHQLLRRTKEFKVFNILFHPHSLPQTSFVFCQSPFHSLVLSTEFSFLLAKWAVSTRQYRSFSTIKINWTHRYSISINLWLLRNDDSKYHFTLFTSPPLPASPRPYSARKAQSNLAPWIACSFVQRLILRCWCEPGNMVSSSRRDETPLDAIKLSSGFSCFFRFITVYLRVWN